LDGVKIRVPLKDIKYALKTKHIKIPKKDKKGSVNVNIERSQSGSITLKLLGRRVDEALDEVDNFISMLFYTV